MNRLAFGLLAAALMGCPGTTDTDTKTTGDTGTDTDTPTDTPTDTSPTGTTEDRFDAYDDADLSDPDIVTWMADASAPNAYFFGQIWVFAAGLNGDDKCPSESTKGTVTTLTGGCTDTDGTVWQGTAEVDESTGSIVYTDFGAAADLDCDKVKKTVEDSYVVNGTVTANKAGDFTVDLDVDQVSGDTKTCTDEAGTATMVYSGSVVPGKAKKEEVWNGSGNYGDSFNGKVAATTVDESIDDTVCSSEASSGTTTLVAGSDTVVITYDGATDCDKNSTVTWTLNGADQGELEGIECSTAGAGTGAGVLGLLGTLLLFRRRRD